MRLALLIGFVTLISACRGDTTKNPDGSTGGDGNGAQKIQDVQNDAMPPGTAVSLKGVVVTAKDEFGGKTGDIWVQEPEGGPFSGVHVFGAPVAQVGGLALGDIVDITGAVKDEFACTVAICNADFPPGMSITELKPMSGGMMTITKTGSGAPLEPQAVDALAIGRMPEMQRNAEWEKWEGVLVKLSSVSALSSDACVGSACNDMTFHKFDITGGAVVESSLAALPTPKVARGDCLGGVVGVADYFFDYLILPRTTAEIMTGGTGCPPPENTQALCTNMVDDDANGFGDCADNACIVAYGPGTGTCRQQVTIPAIQMTPQTGGIQIDSAYVAGHTYSGGTTVPRSLWLQSGPTAATNNGVFAFGSSVDVRMFPIGSKVNIIGTVQEFNDDMTGGTLTEVRPLDIQAVAGAPITLTPIVGQTAAQLIAAGAPYESVLVTLINVRISAIGNSGNGFIATAVQSGTTFNMGTDILRLAAADVACYTTVTGFWTYLVKPNTYGFIPQTLGTQGTLCN